MLLLLLGWEWILLLSVTANNGITAITPRWLCPPEYLTHPLILNPLALNIRRLPTVLLFPPTTLCHHLSLLSIPPTHVYLRLISRSHLFRARSDIVVSGWWQLSVVRAVLMRVVFFFTRGVVVHDVQEETLVQLRVVDWDTLVFISRGLALVEGRRVVVRGVSVYHDQVGAGWVLVEIVGLAHMRKQLLLRRIKTLSDQLALHQIDWMCRGFYDWH